MLSMFVYLHYAEGPMRSDGFMDEKAPGPVMPNYHTGEKQT
jgi:hypothetical protein